MDAIGDSGATALADAQWLVGTLVSPSGELDILLAYITQMKCFTYKKSLEQLLGAVEWFYVFHMKFV